ncbi:hypothetical protein [Flavobacterium sp.]|uniref:hypothetical protein n=1 Tax=Flavobacterium sp. TaxID=239 RepID=UPI0037BEDCC5
MEQISEKNTKTRDLVLSLLLDAVGMMSFSIPFIGEFADVVWAPLSGFIMAWMYKGTMGKVAGVVSFLEEILPATDVIPSFTIMWFYTYIIKKN